MEKRSSTKSFAKAFEGMVISDKMDKTVMVRVNRLVSHSMFEKQVRHRSKFMAHDEKNEAKVGDRVLIAATRPMSRQKRWRVVKIVEKGMGA